MRQSLSPAQVRAAVLRAQGFDAPAASAGPPGTRALLSMVNRLGLLQVDSVNVLARAHYLPLFSRLGPYDRDLLDAASGQSPRRLFEYWGHEASLIPVQRQPLLRWRMAYGHAWSGPRRVAQEQPQLVADVLAVVSQSGPLTAVQLEQALQGEHRRSRDYQWGWNWSDAKRALEYLFGCGVVSTAGRDRTFTRRYDLTERVIPRQVLAAPTPQPADAVRALVESAARALAVATESDLRDYWRLPADRSRTAVAELAEDGVLLPVAVPGWPAAYLHRDCTIPRRAMGQGLLVAFDPMIWNRGRTQRVFDMRYRIEIYTPAQRREFGYYVLPYLHDGRLVARLDLKADRAAGVLRVLGAWSQREVSGPSHPAPARFVDDLVWDLRRLGQWLQVPDVAVTADRGDLAGLLGAALDLSASSA